MLVEVFWREGGWEERRDPARKRVARRLTRQRGRMRGMTIKMAWGRSVGMSRDVTLLYHVDMCNGFVTPYRLINLGLRRRF
jgi:hypothetical protein